MQRSSADTSSLIPRCEIQWGREISSTSGNLLDWTRCIYCKPRLSIFGYWLQRSEERQFFKATGFHTNYFRPQETEQQLRVAGLKNSQPRRATLLGSTEGTELESTLLGGSLLPKKIPASESGVIMSDAVILQLCQLCQLCPAAIRSASFCKIYADGTCRVASTSNWKNSGHTYCWTHHFKMCEYFIHSFITQLFLTINLAAFISLLMSFKRNYACASTSVLFTTLQRTI